MFEVVLPQFFMLRKKCADDYLNHVKKLVDEDIPLGEALDKVARDWFVSRSGLKSAWYRAGYRGG